MTSLRCWRRLECNFERVDVLDFGRTPTFAGPQYGGSRLSVLATGGITFSIATSHSYSTWL